MQGLIALAILILLTHFGSVSLKDSYKKVLQPKHMKTSASKLVDFAKLELNGSSQNEHHSLFLSLLIDKDSILIVPRVAYCDFETYFSEIATNATNKNLVAYIRPQRGEKVELATLTQADFELFKERHCSESSQGYYLLHDSAKFEFVNPFSD